MNKSTSPAVPLDANQPPLEPGQIRVTGLPKAFERIPRRLLDEANALLRGNRQQRRRGERILDKYGLRATGYLQPAKPPGSVQT